MAAAGPGLDGPGTLSLGANCMAVRFGDSNGITVVNSASAAGGFPVVPPHVLVGGKSLGCSSLLFGDGSDGDHTVMADEVLQVDMYYNNLTVAAQKRLNPNGYRIFVRGTLQLDGSIGIPAPSALLNAGAVIGNQNGTLGVGAGGPNGSNPKLDGADGIGVQPSLGGNGGEGGNATGGIAGGGDSLAVAPASRAGGVRVMNDAIAMSLGRDLDGNLIQGGASGGAGGGASAGGTGGGGGGGGGVVVVCAAQILLGPNSAIHAAGGNGGQGGDATGENQNGAGGGGGGGGGFVVVITKKLPAEAPQFTFVNGGQGGAGGLGTGTGANGSPGAAGEDGRAIILLV